MKYKHADYTYALSRDIALYLNPVVQACVLEDSSASFHPPLTVPAALQHIFCSSATCQYTFCSSQHWSTAQGTSAPKHGLTGTPGSDSSVRPTDSLAKVRSANVLSREHQVVINTLLWEKCPLLKDWSRSLWGVSWTEWSRAPKPLLSSSNPCEFSSYAIW